MSKGIMVVLSGPSGAGKGAIRRLLLERRPWIHYGVSATTRPKREGEVDGVSYHFLTVEEFRKRIDEGGFVEWAEVYGHYYGTPREPMEQWLAAGEDVIVEKDPQGAMALRQVYPDAAYVFILPPSFAELRRRITERGTESEEVRAQRLASASKELSYLSKYDYALVNDDLAAAVTKLEAIIDAERLRVYRQPRLLKGFTEEDGQ